MIRHIGYGLLLSVAAAPLAAQPSTNGGTRLSLDDYDAIADISGVSIDANGSRVAAVVSHVDRKANMRRGELIVIPTGGGQPRIVARGDVSAPAWSPDGSALAWIAPDAKGVARLHLMRSGAPERVIAIDATAAHGGVQRFAWSPDSRTIAFIARPPAEPATHDKAFQIADADYLGTTYLARTGMGAPAKIWIMVATGGAARRLDSVQGFPQDLAWHRDGTALFVSSQTGASLVAARFGTLLTVPVDGSPAKVAIASPAPIGTGGRLVVSDRNAVAFQHYRGQDPWTETNNVAVYEGGQPQVVTQSLDRNIDEFDWLPGTQGMVVRAADHNRTRLWRVTQSGTATPIDLGALNALSGVDAGARGGIAFIGSSASSPAEVYYLASPQAKPVRLTHLNDAVAGRRLGKVETVTWRNGGYDHDGVVTYPPGYAAGTKYPLFVDIHGGPEASATDAFDFSAQYYAAQGWIVFQPNYRGSTGQGNAYQTAIIGDATKGSGEDILAGIDALERNLPVDPKRIALSGWSWGGVMTSWLIGQDQRWCAAIPGAMAVDFKGYYDQSETGIWISTLLGSPYVGDNAVKYAKQSPVANLKQASTPTLIIHNVGDPNAPVTQSYTLYHALRDRGVKARMLLRGIDGHGYGDPFSYRQVHSATLGWLRDNCTAARD